MEGIGLCNEKVQEYTDFRHIWSQWLQRCYQDHNSLVVSAFSPSMLDLLSDILSFRGREMATSSGRLMFLQLQAEKEKTSYSQQYKIHGLDVHSPNWLHVPSSLDQSLWLRMQHSSYPGTSHMAPPGAEGGANTQNSMEENHEVVS